MVYSTYSACTYQRPLDVVDLCIFTQQCHISLQILHAPVLVLLDVLTHLLEVHWLSDDLVVVGQLAFTGKLIERFTQYPPFSNNI